MRKIGFIGAGNMAGAIISGIVKSGLEALLSAYDINGDKLRELSEKYEVLPGKSMEEVAADSDYLFLAVKPQNFEEMLHELRSTVNHATVIVSIAAGITARYIIEKLGYEAKIVTVMPNTPLLLGYGASALAKLENVSDEEFAYVRRIFDCAGITAVIPADKMNEIIPINGSSPAFLYRYAQYFIEYGKEAGFDEKICLELFAQTMIGSAKMMLQSGRGLDELIAMVSSKGGTTIAGLEALRADGLEKAVHDCCERCVGRARELAK